MSNIDAITNWQLYATLLLSCRGVSDIRDLTKVPQILVGKEPPNSGLNYPRVLACLPILSLSKYFCHLGLRSESILIQTSLRELQLS